jgi:hypothetical protein
MKSSEPIEIYVFPTFRTVFNHAQTHRRLLKRVSSHGYAAV